MKIRRLSSQELRTGNLINKSGNIVKVEVIMCGFIECTGPMYNYTSTYWHRPIPLTEEWYNQMPEWFSKLISGGYMNMSALPNGYIDVKFVHTAQNLYFALTGEELLLSLP